MRALNFEILAGNACVGCGPDNPDGLRIEVFRDGDRTDRLIGTYRPRPGVVGFPGIVHGGVQFIALDCMAAWVTLVLRAPPRSVPLTRTATVRFHRPVRIADTLALSAEITKEPTAPRDPWLIRGRIHDPKGELLTEIDFDYIALPEDRFRTAVGIEELPEGWRRHFAQQP
jgi:acyl-coenzyme A thioesterase PaaI-like protein